MTNAFRILVSIACTLALMSSAVAVDKTKKSTLHIPFDEVWFVSHDRLLLNKLGKFELDALRAILEDPTSYEGGTCDCKLELYSLFFFSNGKNTCQLTPNLSGSDIGATPDVDDPYSWSEAGLGRLSNLFHHQLVESEARGVAHSNSPMPVIRFIRELQKEKSLSEENQDRKKIETITFAGTLTDGNGKWMFRISFGTPRRSHLAFIGETVDGFTLVEYKKRIETVDGKSKDVSLLTVEHNGEEMVLVRNVPTEYEQ